MVALVRTGSSAASFRGLAHVRRVSAGLLAATMKPWYNTSTYAPGLMQALEPRLRDLTPRVRLKETPVLGSRTEAESMAAE
jgi:hypothetical protein